MAQDLGPWTDLYALGIVAYELLAGRVPFTDGESSMHVLLQHVNDPPPPIHEIRPGVDRELEAWVARLLEKAPEDRPSGAAEARDALEDVVLRLCGPRWRRDAPLPFAAGPAPTRRSNAVAAAPAPSRHSTTVGDEPTRAARRRDPTPADWTTGTADAAAAPAPAPRRLPRGLVPLLVAAMAIGTLAVGARTFSSLSPAQPSSNPTIGTPAVDAASPQLPAATATPAPATPTATPTAAPKGTAAPAAATASASAGTTAPAATAAATPAAAAAPIDPARLADAESESRRWADEAQDTEGDGDEHLTQELRNTSYAYRDAVTAGNAGDAAAYTAALTRADQLARQAAVDLDGD
jgi:hypothetical protein